MAYAVTNLAGAQPINLNSATQRHPVGTLCKAWDPTYGYGEFIYLEGAASTIVGSVVTYDAISGGTTLIPNTANLANPVAVAMAATLDTEWGWYQIAGSAVVAKAANLIASNVKIYISGTAGKIRGSAASGKNILGARTGTTASASAAVTTIVVTINRPHAQGWGGL